MNRLKSLRVERELSIRRLAENTGISHTQISRIERGVQELNGKNAITLADYFGVSIDYLAGYSAEEILNKFVDSYERSFAEFRIDTKGILSGDYRDFSAEMSLKLAIMKYLKFIKNPTNLSRIFEFVEKLALGELDNV